MNNTVVQPHYECAYLYSYLNLTQEMKRVKKKLRAHISYNHFQETNWLPIDKRVDQLHVF